MNYNLFEVARKYSEDIIIEFIGKIIMIRLPWHGLLENTVNKIVVFVFPQL